MMKIKDVANHLGVNWDTVKGIQKDQLKKRYKNFPLKKLKKIAIDEIAIGKGHQYLTIVMDLESGRIVHVDKGKGADALILQRHFYNSPCLRGNFKHANQAECGDLTPDFP